MRFLLILILSTPVFALAVPTIKISSFEMNDSANRQDRTAEICGVITDRDKRHDKIVINSDPGRNQASYIANVAPAGNFCHIIRTNTGRASVEEYSRRPRRPRNLKTYSITN